MGVPGASTYEAQAAYRLMRLYCAAPAFLDDLRTSEDAIAFCDSRGLRAPWAHSAIRAAQHRRSESDTAVGQLIVESARIHFDGPGVMEDHGAPPNFYPWTADDRDSEDWERRVDAEHRAWKDRYRIPSDGRGPLADHVQWLYERITAGTSYAALARVAHVTPDAVEKAVKGLASDLGLQLSPGQRGRPIGARDLRPRRTRK